MKTYMKIAKLVSKQFASVEEAAADLKKDRRNEWIVVPPEIWSAARDELLEEKKYYRIGGVCALHFMIEGRPVVPDDRGHKFTDKDFE